MAQPGAVGKGRVCKCGFRPTSLRHQNRITSLRRHIKKTGHEELR